MRSCPYINSSIFFGIFIKHLFFKLLLHINEHVLFKNLGIISDSSSDRVFLDFGRLARKLDWLHFTVCSWWKIFNRVFFHVFDFLLQPLYIPPHVNDNAYQSRLRSPRLYDPSVSDKQLTPPPYTPPPMLSPRRSGSGLFWQMVSSSGSLTPKSAPVTPRFSLSRKSIPSISNYPLVLWKHDFNFVVLYLGSCESVPKEDELEAPETDVEP